MFPMTHVWFCRQVLGSLSNKEILGAVFPDIVITKCLAHEETHKPGWGLYDYIKQRYPENAKTAMAIATHTVFPEGLDYYGDENYGKGTKGYCFQKGELIVDKVVKCRIPEEFGLWKAHNFIEMSIELEILKRVPELRTQLHEAFNDEGSIGELSEMLGGYMSINPSQLAESFKAFYGFIEIKDINSTSLAEKYNQQMLSKHGISIDIVASAALIEGSRQLIAEDIMQFMQICEARVKDMLERRGVSE